MHTYAVMGVNTALIQAALLSRARIHTILPAKIEARIDMIKGNFKLQLLPVQGVSKIASALCVLFLSISKLHCFAVLFSENDLFFSTKAWRL